MVKIYTNNIRVNGLGIGSSIWGEHDMITPGKRAVVKLDLQSALPLKYWTVFGMTEIANVSFDITQKDFESDVVVDAVGVGIDVSDKMIGFDKSGENLYNKNGLNVILKEIVMESADGGDVFIFLLAENNSDNVLQIDDVYDSLSVNDFMMRYSCYGVDIGVGEWHILKIRLEEDDLAEIGIASLEQITNIEFSISIRDDGHKKIDEPTIAINK